MKTLLKPRFLKECGVLYFCQVLFKEDMEIEKITVMVIGITLG